MTDHERLRDLRADLAGKVRRSITSAHSDSRTVESPQKAAEYVVNMLAVHETDLLRRLAEAFGTKHSDEIATPCERDIG